MRSMVFSADEARALWWGDKTQDRRRVRIRKPLPAEAEQGVRLPENESRRRTIEHCPFGQPGSPVRVREPFQVYAVYPDTILLRYKAHSVDSWTESLVRWPRTQESGVVDTAELDAMRLPEGRFLSATQMPPWATRMTLVLGAIRLERLQAVYADEAAINAEGLRPEDLRGPDNPEDPFRARWTRGDPRREEVFRTNPWVYVLDFEVQRHVRMTSDLDSQEER